MAKSLFNEESIKANLQSILDEIHATDNPEELNELRRIFRSTVPLFTRAYVAGWLLKKAGLAVPGVSSSTRSSFREHKAPTRETRKPREPKPAREPRERTERPTAKEERNSEPTEIRTDVTTLFVGIGRTRRVYPRDLMTLLIENCKLEREAIGNIKILDNYSFVDIANDQAQAVIDVLNNLEYRGRTLSVNFAKKKE